MTACGAIRLRRLAHRTPWAFALARMRWTAGNRVPVRPKRRDPCAAPPAAMPPNLARRLAAIGTPPRRSAGRRRNRTGTPGNHNEWAGRRVSRPNPGRQAPPHPSPSRRSIPREKPITPKRRKPALNSGMHKKMRLDRRSRSGIRPAIQERLVSTTAYSQATRTQRPTATGTAPPRWGNPQALGSVRFQPFPPLPGNRISWRRGHCPAPGLRGCIRRSMTPLPGLARQCHREQRTERIVPHPTRLDGRGYPGEGNRNPRRIHLDTAAPGSRPQSWETPLTP